MGGLRSLAQRWDGELGCRDGMGEQRTDILSCEFVWVRLAYAWVRVLDVASYGYSNVYTDSVVRAVMHAVF